MARIFLVFRKYSEQEENVFSVLNLFLAKKCSPWDVKQTACETVWALTFTLSCPVQLPNNPKWVYQLYSKSSWSLAHLLSIATLLLEESDLGPAAILIQLVTVFFPNEDGKNAQIVWREEVMISWWIQRVGWSNTTKLSLNWVGIFTQSNWPLRIYIKTALHTHTHNLIKEREVSDQLVWPHIWLMRKLRFQQEKWYDLSYPGKPHGRMGLEGCSPWGCEESDTTEQLHFSFSCTGEGNGNALQGSCLENPRDGGDGLPSIGSHRVRHDWSDPAAGRTETLMAGEQNGLLFCFSLHCLSLLKNHAPQFKVSVLWEGKRKKKRLKKKKKATGFLDQRILGSIGRTKLMFFFTARLRIVSMSLCTMNL